MTEVRNNKTDINTENTLVNKYLCNFIANKFLRKPHNKKGDVISQNKYAELCGLSSSTISKLKDIDGYDVPLSTIYNICRFENYSLRQLFAEFEDEYGVNIPN